MPQMTKENLEALKSSLLEKLFCLSKPEKLPGRLLQIEETHKRLNAVERCLESLKPQGSSQN